VGREEFLPAAVIDGNRNRPDCSCPVGISCRFTNHVNRLALNPIEVFRRYVEDRRQQRIEQFDRECFEHLVRYTARIPGAEGMVAYANLKPGCEVQQIIEQVDYFTSIRQNFEWKVYEFDQPHDLQALLAAESFVADEQEAFMVLPLDRPSRQVASRHGAWEIRRVSDDAGVRDVVALQERVWGREFPWLYPQLAKTRQRRPTELSIYCAYAGGEPVGTGYTEFPPGSGFPELHGGAVLESWRGRGMYSDIFAVRLEEAKQRLYDLICVDAAPMSRPILEKIGFQRVCSTVPMRKTLVE
jgi:hypothetical protein